MNIRARAQGSVQILDLQGALDMVGAALLRDRLHEVLEAGGRGAVLNLQEVPTMDSSGLGALVTLHLEFQKQGASIAVFGVSPSVGTVLAATNLDNFVPIMNSEEQALSLFD